MLQHPAKKNPSGNRSVNNIKFVVCTFLFAYKLAKPAKNPGVVFVPNSDL